MNNNIKGLVIPVSFREAIKMTNLLDKHENTLYCDVTGINRIWFQRVSNRSIFVTFNYASNEEGRFEIYVEGGVDDSSKARFLIEVHSLLVSIFSNNDYIATVEDIINKVNNIEI